MSCWEQCKEVLKRTGGSTQKELVETIGRDQSTISKALNNAVARGEVEFFTKTEGRSHIRVYSLARKPATRKEESVKLYTPDDIAIGRAIECLIRGEVDRALDLLYGGARDE